MRFTLLSAFILFLSSFQSIAFAATEFDYELDPYYSNVSMYVPFNEEKIPTLALANELEIYLTLLKDILTPRFFVLEVSANPLPILGSYLKEQQNDFYKKFKLNDNLNAIAAVTEGFEEPYAISLFLGNVIKFTLPGETQSESINKGFSGLLLSFGDKHIRFNNLIDDKWFELEWKLKGDRRLANLYHSFSFRVGTKRHSNENIEDSYYIGIRRELFNSKVQSYRFYHNVGLDIRIDLSRDNNQIIQSEVFIDKRWPTDKAEVSFGIGFKQVNNKYLNELSHLNQDISLILRPSINF